MYRLRWYCCAILNGGRFGDLHTIYQGCRALPFALAGLSCSWLDVAPNGKFLIVPETMLLGVLFYAPVDDHQRPNISSIMVFNVEEQQYCESI